MFSRQRLWRIARHNRWFWGALALLNLVPAAWLMENAPIMPIFVGFVGALFAVSWACFEAAFTAKDRKEHDKQELYLSIDEMEGNY